MTDVRASIIGYPGIGEQRELKFALEKHFRHEIAKHEQDTACLLNIAPGRYTALGLSPLDTYFAMARGYQGEHGDVKALSMRKWLHTSYHYMVPEIDNDAECSWRTVVAA